MTDWYQNTMFRCGGGRGEGVGWEYFEICLTSYLYRKAFWVCLRTFPSTEIVQWKKKNAYLIHVILSTIVTCANITTHQRLGILFFSRYTFFDGRIIWRRDMALETSTRLFIATNGSRIVISSLSRERRYSDLQWVWQSSRVLLARKEPICVRLTHFFEPRLRLPCPRVLAGSLGLAIS